MAEPGSGHTALSQGEEMMNDPTYLAMLKTPECREIGKPWDEKEGKWK